MQLFAGTAALCLRALRRGFRHSSAYLARCCPRAILIAPLLLSRDTTVHGIVRRTMDPYIRLVRINQTSKDITQLDLLPLSVRRARLRVEYPTLGEETKKEKYTYTHTHTLAREPG